MIDLTLNGETETQAVFDTGATFALVGSKTADAVGLTHDENGPTIKIVGLGVAGTFPVADIAHVEVAGAGFSQIQVALNPEFSLTSTDTVVPSTLLPHRTLDFDFSNTRLRAYDRRPDKVMRAVTSRLPVTWINGLPFIDVEVNGRKGKALVDTGASNTFINSAFAKKAARSAKDYSQIEVISSTGIVTPLRVLSSRRFTVGDFKITRFDVIVLDPEFLASCGLQDEPVMVMGLDILRQFRMQLDRESHEIRLSQPNPLMRPGSTIYFNGN